MEINPAPSRMTLVAAPAPAPVAQGEARHLAYDGDESARLGGWSDSCVLGRTVTLSTDIRTVALLTDTRPVVTP